MQVRAKIQKIRRFLNENDSRLAEKDFVFV
jgi:hypothetical protein